MDGGIEIESRRGCRLLDVVRTWDEISRCGVSVLVGSHRFHWVSRARRIVEDAVYGTFQGIPAVGVCGLWIRGCFDKADSPVVWLGRLGRGYFYRLAAGHGNLVDRSVQLEAVGRRELLDEIGTGCQVFGHGVPVFIGGHLCFRFSGACLVGEHSIDGTCEGVPAVGSCQRWIGRALLELYGAVVRFRRFGGSDGYGLSARHGDFVDRLIETESRRRS